MKRLFIAVALLTATSTMSLQAQTKKVNNLTVTAQIKGLAAGQWVYYGQAVRGAKMDSVKTSAGGFIIHTYIAKGEGNIYLFRIGKENIANTAFTMFVDRGEVHVTAGGPYFTDPKFTGSAFVMDDNNYKAALRSDATLAKTKDVEQKAMAAYQQKDEAAFNALRPQLQARQAEVLRVTKKWIAAHPNSEYSTVLIATSLARMQPMSATMEDFKKLTPEAKDNAIGKQLTVIAKKQSAVAIGKPAPDFSQQNSNGKLIKLSDFRGKYVLIDFWASWCKPCRAENPNVVKAYNKYKTKNFTILGVSLDKNKENWLQAIQKDGLAWTEVSDLKFWKNDAAVKYGVNGIPANFLVDPHGKIIAANLRGEDLENKLKEILGS